MSTQRTSAHACEIGDHFLLRDEPDAFAAREGNVWTGPDGQEREFELIEVPCEGGTDFAWRRVS